MEKYLRILITKRLFQTILLNSIVFLLYLLAGKFGLTLAFLNPSATAIWPPTGIALIALLFFGYRLTPAIFLGALVVNSTTAGTLFTSLSIATGNTLEAIIGTYCVKKFAHGNNVFENSNDIFRFVFWAGIISTAISATIGTTTLVISHLASSKTFMEIWTTWWLGDMGGSLIVAPFFLIVRKNFTFSFRLRHLLHFSAAFLFLLLTTLLIFSGILPYAYLSIPIAVWIAFWFGQRGASIATIFTAILAITYTLHGKGPFADHSLNKSLLLLQLFLNVFSITVLIFATVVAALKKGEKTLVSHESRFKALIDKSFDAVVLIDTTSKILYASASVKKLLGYTSEELVGTPGFDLVASADKDKTIQTLAKLVLTPGKTVTVEYRTVKKDGTIIWVEATGTNLLLDPNVTAVVVNFHDITEKKIAEEKMLQEKLEDEAMLTSIGEGIIATDNTGKITMVNQTTCDMLGWSEKELLGKIIIDAIAMQNDDGKSIPKQNRPMTKVLTLGKKVVTSLDNYYLRKDGTRMPVQLTVTPVILHKNIIGTIEVFHDITKEREIDKAKTEFVSVASHQLRTPLATINWYLEQLLKAKIRDTKQAAYLEEVSQASHRMVTLINALLNASRLELGTFIVEPQQADAVKIMQKIIAEMHPQILEKHIILQTHFAQNVPSFFADPKLLSILYQNLLSNAIKYSKNRGRITITFSHDKTNLHMKIQDEGYGIPKEQQKKIFTKMFRADNAKLVDPEGTGLGLYIVKSITDSTGGKITFISEENKGTTFFLSYPLTGMKKKAGKKQLR